jgi:hypothetical protein
MYNLSINTGGCSLMSAPLDYTLTSCEKCKIDYVNPKEVKEKGGKFCAFTATITISCNADMAVTFVAPNNDVLIDPSSFTIHAGVDNYIFTIIPLDGFVAGPITIQINSLTSEGKPCVYLFTIEVPACSETSAGKFKSTATTFDGAKSVVLFPNPAKEEVNIHYQGLAQDATIELYDLTGRNLAFFTVKNNNGILNVPTGSYPSGVYVVVVHSDNAIVTQQKLVIE